MSNLTDEAVHDAKQGAKAVSSTVRAVKQGVKDAKVVGKAARQAATGDFVGAATTMVTHPETLVKVIAAANCHRAYSSTFIAFRIYVSYSDSGNDCRNDNECVGRNR